jgi:alpha/beta superfamily hydrolase
VAIESGALTTIESPRGPIQGRFHHRPNNTVGIIWVGGFDGGFDGPADAIFPDLAEDLLPQGMSSLRLDYRIKTSPGIVEEGAYDVLHGIAFLVAQGISSVGLVGHSFGAAVVITAGVASPHVKTVVSLSAQTAGAQGVRNLAPKSILFIHGTDDIRLLPQLSEYLHKQAGEPKKLVLLEGARHSLRQKREELRTLVRDWLVRELGEAQDKGHR